MQEVRCGLSGRWSCTHALPCTGSWHSACTPQGMSGVASAAGLGALACPHGGGPEHTQDTRLNMSTGCLWSSCTSALARRAHLQVGAKPRPHAGHLVTHSCTAASPYGKYTAALSPSRGCPCCLCWVSSVGRVSCCTQHSQADAHPHARVQQSTLTHLLGPAGAHTSCRPCG